MTRLFIFLCIVSLGFLSGCAAAPGEEIPASVPTELAAPEFVQSLTTSLASELQIDTKDVELVSVEKVQWRDSCLGVERKGMMCMEVITPGYLIVIKTPNGVYEAHTNEDGTAFLFIPQEQTPTPTSSTDS